MLAIGEWLRSTSPEKVEVEMNSAGYRLERTETFLEANGLYIYVFRVAQQQRSLRDQAYLHEVLEKVDSLLESKYVLPDRAAVYAEEFRSRYTSGAYDSYTDPARFAEKVTADLIEITGDFTFQLQADRSE
jgi:uncharacterized protein YfcZ (UPF0381/DUF406 family)